jgi:hypothetical protein
VMGSRSGLWERVDVNINSMEFSGVLEPSRILTVMVPT